MKRKLINSLKIDIENQSNKKPKGWTSIKRMNQNIINILESSDLEINDTYSVLNILRSGGMSLKGEYKPWRTKTMQKVELLLNNKTVNNIMKGEYLLNSSDSDIDSYDSDSDCQNVISNGEENILSVSDINTSIKSALEGNWGIIKIKGEITGKSIHNGNIYLYLKDASSRIKAVVWRSVAYNLDDIGNGVQVIATGKLSLYLKSGEYQLTINHWNEVGKGGEADKLLALKNSFERKGYFSQDHKLLVPKYPFTIGIISSPEAAGFRDAVYKIRSLNKWIKIVLSPCSVQGRDCPKSVVMSFWRLQAYSEQVNKINVILIVRGGGSVEDMSGFNDKGIIEAIYKSDIPVVTGIGHEKDTCLADLVADKSAITPTAAAELVTPYSIDIYNQLTLIKRQVITRIKQKFIENDTQLGRLLLKIKGKKPKTIESWINEKKMFVRQEILNKILSSEKDIGFLKNKLTYLFITLKKCVSDEKIRLHQVILDKMDLDKQKIQNNFNLLQAKNPINILKSGFIAIQDETHQLYDADKTRSYIREKKPITLVLQDGSEIRVCMNILK